MQKYTRLFNTHSGVRKKKVGDRRAENTHEKLPLLHLVRSKEEPFKELHIPEVEKVYAYGGRKNSRRFGYVKRITSVESVLTETILPAVFSAVAFGHGQSHLVQSWLSYAIPARVRLK